MLALTGGTRTAGGDGGDGADPIGFARVPSGAEGGLLGAKLERVPVPEEKPEGEEPSKRR